MPTTKECTEIGCPNPAYCRGLCHLHYDRWYKTGSTAPPQRSFAKDELCSHEGCPNNVYGKGLCRKHYDMIRRRGTTEPPAPKIKDTCSEPSCPGVVHSRDLCQNHYRLLMRNGSTTKAQQTTEERFLSYVCKTQTCWFWTGSLDSKGHGKFHDPERYASGEFSVVGAHKWAFEHWNGPVPEGLILDHTCHDPTVCKLGTECPHRSCVNPSHLEAIPRRVNTSSDRSASSAKNKERAAAQTHCKRGHEFTPGNTHLTKEGFRVCKTCQRERQQKWRNNQ